MPICARGPSEALSGSVLDSDGEGIPAGAGEGGSEITNMIFNEERTMENNFDVDEYKLTEGMSAQEFIAMLPKIHKLLLQVLQTYMDVDDDTLNIIAAWTLAAPYYEAFDAFPYLYVNGSKSSGKTRLLHLLSELIPRSILVISVSQSALFRIRSTKTAVMIDEAERLHGKEKEALLDLLNAGYKRGGKVLRVGKTSKGELKVEEYDVYGPYALSNIWGLDSVLESRCISLILQRTDKQMAPEMFAWDQRIKVIHDFFCASAVYVSSFIESAMLGSLRQDYLNQYNIYIPTQPTQSYTNTDINQFLQLMKVVQVNGRDYELWLPLLATTYIVDLDVSKGLVSIIRRAIEARQEDEAENDKDSYFGLQLYLFMSVLQKDDPTASLVFKDFIAWLDSPPEWLRAEWLSRFIKRLGIRKSQTRTSKGNRYEIRMPTLKHYLQVRGLLTNNDTSPNHASPSLALPDGSLSRFSGGGEPPKPINLAGESALCGICGAKTSELWDYSHSWMCKTCLDAAREGI